MISYAHYLEDNFGDSITGDIIKSLSHQESKAVPHNDAENKIIAVGSHLHLMNSHTVVWGAGVLEEDVLPLRNLVDIEVRLVRGPRTAKVLDDAGYVSSNTVYGDTGVFAPFAYKQYVKVEQPFEVGIVPHYREFRLWKDKKLPEGCILIDVTLPPQQVIAAMSSCKRLICSALHGIVCGEAMGIPCSYYRWIDHCSAFKYFDYFEGTNRNPHEMPRMDLRYFNNGVWKVQDLLQLQPLPLPQIDFKGMMEVAPFEISQETKDEVLLFYENLRKVRNISKTQPQPSQKTKKQPKFSLVIPCYNAAGYITRCLSSIAKQTHGLDDVEIVFVDNGSTDGSGAIAERFAVEFPNFHVVTSKNPTGPGGARNLGVAKSSGEYLFFIDCDDYIPEKSLELINNAIVVAKNPDVILYPYVVERAEGSRRRGGLMKPPFKKIEEIANHAVGPWSAVFKRSLFVPFPEQILSEDTAWHFLQYDKFNSFFNIPVDMPCYVYDRKNATAITDTVEWAGENSFTMEQLAMGDAAIKAGKRDKWISDVIRNYANMYDVRTKLTKPWVKAAWANRFKTEIMNLSTGHYVH